MPSGSRRRTVVSVAIVVSLAVISNMSAAAINAATAQDRWPGVLDTIRQHPFMASASLTTVAAVLSGVLWLREQAKPADEQAFSWLSVRRARNSRKRLVQSLLPGRFGFNVPTWTDGDSLADLPVMTSFQLGESKAPASRRRHSGVGVSSVEKHFNRSGGRLLVLGEVGVGKTYALLTVSREMLNAAQKDPRAPVPLYFDLSEWPGSKLTLEEWLIFAGKAHYGLPEDVLRFWLSVGECAIAFDSLDEMSVGARNGCVSSINTLLASYPSVCVLIACRKKEYEQCRRGLDVRGELIISDISTAQLLSILERICSGGSGLPAMAARDRKFRDMLRRPLFLQLAAMSRGVTSSGVRPRRGKWSDSIIDSYLDRVSSRLSGEGMPSGALPEWLPGLAKHLRGTDAATFYPDRIPLQLMTDQLRGKVARMAGAICAAFAFSAIAVVRAITWIAMPNHELSKVYFSSGLLLLLVVPWAAWSIAGRCVSAPPVGRRAVFANLTRRVMPNFAIAYSTLGAVAASGGEGMLGIVVFILLPIVGAYPGIVLLKSSRQLPDVELPRYPGEEIRRLCRTTLVSAAVVAVTLSASLSLTLGPLDLANNEFFPLRIWSLLPYFVVPFAVVVGIANGGADMAARYAARRVLARHKMLPDSFEDFDKLRRSSVLVPSGGGLSFVHALVRDHISCLRPEVPADPRYPQRFEQAPAGAQ